MAVQQQDAQLTAQPLQLLAQGRLDDVLPGGRPAEVQLLDRGDEVAQLAKLHAPIPGSSSMPETSQLPTSLPTRPRKV